MQYPHIRVQIRGMLADDDDDDDAVTASSMLRLPGLSQFLFNFLVVPQLRDHLGELGERIAKHSIEKVALLRAG